MPTWSEYLQGARRPATGQDSARGILTECREMGIHLSAFRGES